MAGPSTAAGGQRDVQALFKKLGVKTFCDEYRRDAAAGENLAVTGAQDRPSDHPQPVRGHSGQTGNDWAASCCAPSKSAEYTSCLRYARGVADGLIIAQILDEIVAQHHSIPQTSTICIDGLATSDQLLEIGLRYWSKSNAETRNYRAAEMLSDAWKEKWPCPRGEAR